MPSIYFSGKSGNSNIFTIMIRVDKLEKLLELIDVINRAFEATYWDTKNEKI